MGFVRMNDITMFVVPGAVLVDDHDAAWEGINVEAVVSYGRCKMVGCYRIEGLFGIATALIVGVVAFGIAVVGAWVGLNSLLDEFVGRAHTGKSKRARCDTHGDRVAGWRAGQMAFASVVWRGMAWQAAGERQRAGSGSAKASK